MILESSVHLLGSVDICFRYSLFLTFDHGIFTL
jgi:hypothetical protein